MKSLRILWRDVGLDYADHVLPGAFGFLVEGKTTAGWETLLDLQTNNSDVNCGYYPCVNKVCSQVRLRIVSAPPGITPGVINFTAFGEYHGDLF